jgi:hypothetical protein
VANVLLLLVAAGLAFGPRALDGHAAVAWTRHLSLRNQDTPRALDARAAGRWAARAIDALAPLPGAGEAARLALDYGRRLAPRDPAAARALATPVREALDRAVSSRLRGLGLGGLAEEARRLEAAPRVEPEEDEQE